MIERQYKYYDLKKKWRKVKPHLGDKRLNDILVRDFNKYTVGRWGKEFASGQYPTEFESCDWQSSHRGRKPAFRKYTKHAACHWLVNFTLRLAMLVEPDQKWRIITSQKHSTVWNGDDTLFDFNFRAFGIEPNECFQLANVKELRPGKYMRVYFAAHYTEEQYAIPTWGLNRSGTLEERLVKEVKYETKLTTFAAGCIGKRMAHVIVVRNMGLGSFLVLWVMLFRPKLSV